METPTLTVLLDQHSVSKERLRELYLCRPKCLILLPYGKWFCLAAGIKDTVLSCLEYSQGEPYVVNAAYDMLPNLEQRLIHFNLFHTV